MNGMVKSSSVISVRGGSGFVGVGAIVPKLFENESELSLSFMWTAPIRVQLCGHRWSSSNQCSTCCLIGFR